MTTRKVIARPMAGPVENRLHWDIVFEGDVQNILREVAMFLGYPWSNFAVFTSRDIAERMADEWNRKQAK